MSERGADLKVITASYAPDQAGKQVGWVSTVAKENVGQFNDVDIVEINVGVASVSEKGSQRGYTLRTDGDEIHTVTFPNDVTGFVAASALRLEIIRGMSVKEAVGMRSIDLEAATFDRDASQMVSGAFDLENVKLVEDPQKLLAELKRRLKDEDVEEDYYHAIYYGLNTAIGHAGVRSCFRNYVSIDQNPPFVADPEMQETTATQLEASEAILDDLTKIQEEDSRMLDNLKVSSSIPPDVFKGSRYAVHIAEMHACAQAYTRLLIPRYTYVYPRSGSLPLTIDNPPDADYEKAFRGELAALRKKETRSVEQGLVERIKETTRRLELAHAAVQMLHGLLAAEKIARL